MSIEFTSAASPSCASSTFDRHIFLPWARAFHSVSFLSLHAAASNTLDKGPRRIDIANSAFYGLDSTSSSANKGRRWIKGIGTSCNRPTRHIKNSCMMTRVCP